MEQSDVELHHLEFHHHDLMFSYFCYCFLLDLSKHYQTHQPVSQLSFCKYSPLAPKIDHLLTWQYELFVHTKLAAEKAPRIARFYFWGKHNCTRFCPFQSSTVQTDNSTKGHRVLILLYPYHSSFLFQNCILSKEHVLRMLLRFPLLVASTVQMWSSSRWQFLSCVWTAGETFSTSILPSPPLLLLLLTLFRKSWQ